MPLICHPAADSATGRELTEPDTDCTQPRSSIPVRLSPEKTSLYTISIIRTKNDFQENVEESTNSQQGQRDKKTGEETFDWISMALKPRRY